MAHHVDARFDEADNTFIPPLRTLGFNQNLTMNDSLLVQSYIESYDISYPEALRRVESEVEELRQHLQAEGCYELNDIGVLTLNVEGNIKFAPCEAGILTPTLYGLGTFEMQPLKKPEVATAAVAEPVTAHQTETVAVNDERERAIVIKMSWLRNAVAVAAAIVTFFMIGTPVSNSETDAQLAVQQSSFIPISAQSPAAESNKIEAEPVESVVEEPIVFKEMETTEKPATTKGADTPAMPAANAAAKVSEDFCIVLASQVSKKNADGFVEQLSKNGFKDAYITNTKFRRVVYGHYPTKDEALSQLRQLRQQNKMLFGEGWVMKSNN